MSEKKFSLFELHFHDSVQFGPRTLDGLGGADETVDEQPAGLPSEEESPALEEAPIEEEDDSSSSIVRRLIGLGMLAGAAYAVRKLLDSEPSGLDALDDIEAGIDDAEEPTENNESVSIEVTSGEVSGFEDESSTDSGRTGLTLAAGIALVVVLALAARKLLGNTVEEIEIPDELAEE